jgi:hypothetical protein
LIRALAPFGGPTTHAIAHRVAMDGPTVPSLPPGSIRPSTLDPQSDPTPALETYEATQADHHSPTVIPSAPPSALNTERDLFRFLETPKRGPRGEPRNIIFMLGSGFSLATRASKGVPGTRAVVDQLKLALSADERSRLEIKLETSEDHYQTAFSHLAAVDTQDAANRIIRSAVLTARKQPVRLPEGTFEESEACKRFERELDEWSMPEGCRDLGALIASGLGEAGGEPERPENARFSKLHLTTNFDPLLAISVRRRKRFADATTIDRDYALPALDSQVCRIVHLHGRWDRGDTLNTDLQSARPELEDSLRDLLRWNTLVVLGYGGWEDVFMQTLDRVAPHNVDIRWAFREESPEQLNEDSRKRIFKRKDRLRERMVLYYDVEVNRLFRDLRERLAPVRPETPSTPKPPRPPIVGPDERAEPPMVVIQQPVQRESLVSPLPLPPGGLSWRQRLALILAAACLAAGAFLFVRSLHKTVQTHVCIRGAGGCRDDALKLTVAQNSRSCTVSPLDDACCAQVECGSLQGLKVKVNGSVKKEQWVSGANDPIEVAVDWPPAITVTGCPPSAGASDPPVPTQLMIASPQGNGSSPVSLSPECTLPRPQELAAALPSVVAHFTVELDDPFYAVAAPNVKVREGVATVELQRKPNLELPVDLSGDCPHVTAATFRSGDKSSRVTFANCKGQGKLALPSSAFGSELSILLEPPQYLAKPVRVNAASLVIPVQRVQASCPPECITVCTTRADAMPTGSREQWFNDCLTRRPQCRHCPQR